MIRACALTDLPPGETVRIVGPRAHTASSDLRTGKPACLPAKRPVRTCPVHVEDGGVYVDTEVNRDVA
ncbi:hypothetical protein LX88_007662 [Lentzea californiensis]|nr:hypothetical protein [Lentzea californiensis]MCR3753653.1 hypothetical protein [Lentzea californiensis]